MKRKEFLKDAVKQDVKELRARIRSNSEEQMKLRFRKSSGQLQQTHRIRILKKERARLLTISKQSSSGKGAKTN